MYCCLHKRTLIFCTCLIFNLTLFATQPPMMPGSSPAGVLSMINGHRSPVFGGPVPLGMSPSIPPPGMPIPMGASPRQGAAYPINGTPPYRNSSTPLNRQSPGMFNKAQNYSLFLIEWKLWMKVILCVYSMYVYTLCEILLLLVTNFRELPVLVKLWIQMSTHIPRNH